MTDQLADLIARLEKATGPDAGLDLMIAEAVGLKPSFGATGSVGGGWLPYTTSIDAALTLVPEECVWALNFASMATIMRVGPNGVIDGEIIGQWPSDQNEAEQPVKPAIALCIASLKARAALTKAQARTVHRRLGALTWVYSILCLIGPRRYLSVSIWRTRIALLKNGVRTAAPVRLRQ